METVFQSPYQLELGVLQGIPPPQVTVLETDMVSFGDWRVNFFIIGESHKVEVLHKGKLVLTELLACMPINPGDCKHHHQFLSGESHAWKGFGLSMEIEFLCNTHPLPKFDNQIVFEFPITAGTVPITRVEWQLITDNLIEWRTLHLYPDNNGYISVVSRSRLRLNVLERSV